MNPNEKPCPSNAIHNGELDRFWKYKLARPSFPTDLFSSASNRNAAKEKVSWCEENRMSVDRKHRATVLVRSSSPLSEHFTELYRKIICVNPAELQVRPSPTIHTFNGNTDTRTDSCRNEEKFYLVRYSWSFQCHLAIHRHPQGVIIDKLG